MGFNVGGNFTSGDFKYAEGSMNIGSTTAPEIIQPTKIENNIDDEDLKQLIVLLQNNNEILHSISSSNSDVLKVLNTSKDESVKQLASKLIVKFGELGFEKIKKYFD
jgi:hypothetical protein